MNAVPIKESSVTNILVYIICNISLLSTYKNALIFKIEINYSMCKFLLIKKPRTVDM